MMGFLFGESLTTNEPHTSSLSVSGVLHLDNHQ